MESAPSMKLTKGQSGKSEPAIQSACSVWRAVSPAIMPAAAAAAKLPHMPGPCSPKSRTLSPASMPKRMQTSYPNTMARIKVFISQRLTFQASMAADQTYTPACTDALTPDTSSSSSDEARQAFAAPAPAPLMRLPLPQGPLVPCGLKSQISSTSGWQQRCFAE